MSDQRERRAERDGDAAAAQRERCRRGEHAPPKSEGAIYLRSSEGSPLEAGNYCACGAWVVDSGVTLL